MKYHDSESGLSADTEARPSADTECTDDKPRRWAGLAKGIATNICIKSQFHTETSENSRFSRNSSTQASIFSSPRISSRHSPHFSSFSPRSVTVGFSGGVDSTAAVLLMKERFKTVIAATMWLYDGQAESFDQIKMLSDALGVRHIVLDFRQAFQDEVVSAYLGFYESGLTPNPCIICNKAIKYGRFLDAIDTDYLALGHYARKVSINGEYRLLRSHALRKDQSYNLFSLTQRQLERILFPIGEFTSKEEVRAYCSEYFSGESEYQRGYADYFSEGSDYFTGKGERIELKIPVQSESMGACFLSGKSHTEYLKSIGARTARSGNFVDKCGTILGEHEGIAAYTIGQKPRIRKAYPVDGMTSPYWTPGVVCGFDLERNEVIIGEESDVYAHRIVLSDFNIVSDFRRAEIPCLEVNSDFTDSSNSSENEPVNDAVNNSANDSSPGIETESGGHKFVKSESAVRSVSEPLRVEVRLSQWSEVYFGKCWFERSGIRGDNNPNEDKLIFESDSTKPMRAPAPGQAAVLYIGDELIGGGTITLSLG